MRTPDEAALAAAIAQLFQMGGPKLGKRFRCGQIRCTEIGRHGQQIDRSELRNFHASKYQPHQGKRETERRRARGW